MMIMTGLPTIHFSTIKTLRAVLLLAVALSAGSLSAQGRVFWQDSGVVLCDTTWHGGMQALALVPDGQGGAVAVWPDRRGDLGSVYAQRVDSAGNVRWPAGGVLMKDDVFGAEDIVAVPDGHGGLIAAWCEYYCWPNAVQLTAQRVDSSGNIKWGPSGVALAGSGPTGDYRYKLSAVADGAGGALFASFRRLYLPDSSIDTVCVQLLDSLGRHKWPPAGVPLNARACVLAPPTLLAAANGGAFAGWSEITPGDSTRACIQRLDTNAQPQWPRPGVSPCSSGRFVSITSLIDVPNAVLVAFANGDGFRAQLLDSAGVRCWGLDGRVVFPEAALGNAADVAVQPAGGAGTYWLCATQRLELCNIYGQLLDSQGNRRWDSMGVLVGETHAPANPPHGPYVEATSDGASGVIVAWTAVVGTWDVYAQKLDEQGELRWGTSGLAVAFSPRDESWRPCLVPDGHAGAIVAWAHAGLTPQEPRAGVKAQRIGDAVGLLSPLSKENLAGGLTAWPSPARTGTVIRATDHSSQNCAMEIVGVAGRRVALLHTRAGESAYWDLRDDSRVRVADGVYFCRLIERQTGGQVMIVVLH